MTISIEVIHKALVDNFGFKNILWVYSGRRGVHCWVCDPAARKLPAEARKAIISYLEVIKGGDSQSKKVNLPKILHPFLKSSFDICKSFFYPMIEQMGTFDKKENYDKLLELIPDQDIKKELEAEWENSSKTSRQKFEDLEIEIQRSKKPALSTTVRDIIFQYSYPRLDSNVSIGLNHLLKAPFCVHPKTGICCLFLGRVCVPIDPMKARQFDPFSAPEIFDLLSKSKQDCGTF